VDVFTKLEARDLTFVHSFVYVEETVEKLEKIRETIDEIVKAEVPV